jgi:hypothetical protein
VPPASAGAAAAAATPAGSAVATAPVSSSSESPAPKYSIPTSTAVVAAAAPAADAAAVAAAGSGSFSGPPDIQVALHHQRLFCAPHHNQQTQHTQHKRPAFSERLSSPAVAPSAATECAAIQQGQQHARVNGASVAKRQKQQPYGSRCRMSSGMWEIDAAMLAAMPRAIPQAGSLAAAGSCSSTPDAAAQQLAFDLQQLPRRTPGKVSVHSALRAAFAASQRLLVCSASLGARCQTQRTCSAQI